MGFFTRAAGTDATRLADRLADPAVHILDVRQPSEWRHPTDIAAAFSEANPNWLDDAT